MIDINDIIKETAKRTGYDEKLVEKAVRSMFEDVQKFTSKKQGFCIQVPNLGTFRFRANAIPNYSRNQKGTLVHWIGRILVGKEKTLPKTIYAGKANILKCFECLKAVALIKKEFIEKHSKYKPITLKYLMDDNTTDVQRVDEYIETVKAQLFSSEDYAISKEDLRAMFKTEDIPAAEIED